MLVINPEKLEAPSRPPNGLQEWYGSQWCWTLVPAMQILAVGCERTRWEKTRKLAHWISCKCASEKLPLSTKSNIGTRPVCLLVHEGELRARIFALGQEPLFLRMPTLAFCHHPGKSTLQVEMPKWAHTSGISNSWSSCSVHEAWAVLCVSFGQDSPGYFTFSFDTSQGGKYSIAQPVGGKRHGSFLVVCWSWLACITCIGCVSKVHLFRSQLIMSNHLTSLNQS